ncbi:class F sortase [Streptomyces albicerus]|uniref:class F sortase n=1 Tax=Streptomyces albicerus TaxID=2569859 RepID=UPI00124BAFC8|nr:class F sortase [Streptomyces albicerus]
MAASPPSPTDAGPVPSKRRLRTGVTVFWCVAALVLVVSLVVGHDESSDAARVPHAPPAAAPSSSALHHPGKHLPRSRPTRLLIPKISVDAPFTDLAIGRSGRLEPPPADDVNLVGWHAKGAAPGEAGTSIIAGHVDTATSPAVFAELGELRKGDRFQVARDDGRKAAFVVDSVETFDKGKFPDQRVYADTPQAQVRLITCAGDYDRATKDYTENLVVFAHLT